MSTGNQDRRIRQRETVNVPLNTCRPAGVQGDDHRILCLEKFAEVILGGL